MGDAEILDERLRQRYARQLILPGFGEEGQARLARASVLLVGLGGLGSPAALYLAAAGVGRLSLVEFDEVDRSNLQRQVLYGEPDVGRPKLDAAIKRLTALNPDIRIDRIEGPLDASNALEMVRGHDVVLDGTDNFTARYAVNDACALAGIPNVHGAVQGFQGLVTVLAYEEGPCYRCLFPEPPPAGSVPGCAEAGVLGVLPGTIGVLQATEAIKIIAGIGELLVGRLLRFDALAARFTEVAIARDADCAVCGEAPTIEAPERVADTCEQVSIQEDLPFSIAVDELAQRVQTGNAPQVLDVRLTEELELAALSLDSVHIPLHLLPVRVAELDHEREYAVLCHHGARSMQAVQFLRSSGYRHARNIVGGIDRWSDHVDPAVPRY